MATEQIVIPSNTEVSLFCNKKGMYGRPSRKADGRKTEGTFFLPEECCQINVFDDRTVSVIYPYLERVIRQPKQVRMIKL